MIKNFSKTALYKKGDLVEFNGDIYQALRTSFGVTPENTDFWNRYSPPETSPTSTLPPVQVVETVKYVDRPIEVEKIVEKIIEVPAKPKPQAVILSKQEYLSLDPDPHTLYIITD